jgi:pimeloyl-ACP methyl ester carboxylesterase
MNRTIQVILSWILVSLLCGCLGHAPLKTLNYSSSDNSTQKNLLVFLRGIGGSHRDFAREGFVDSVRQRQLPFDITAPNSHFGYYFSETITVRLETDIILPAKAKGYEKIWLVGVSMGGFGSLMYAKDHPGKIDGIYVIAPFLGYEEIVAEITAAGGVHQWQPGEYDPNDDWERMFWHWLKQCAEGEKQMPNLYLGFGRQDDFNPAHQLLIELLPEDHILSINGGHDTKTMKELWFLFLQRDLLK